MRQFHRLIAVFACSLPAFAQAVTYDIVYVRAPRKGDNANTRWPEVFNPTHMEPGADLMLLHPNGAEEVLFPGGNGAVVDPTVSFDAKWVYFSYFPDLRAASLNPQRGDLPRAGADIYKIEVATKRAVRLTRQSWTPPSGASKWSTDHLSPSSPDAYYLGYGIFNLAPCPLPGGRVMFTSSRDGYLPNKSYTNPNLRLYIMDDDGANAEPVGHLNIGSALHPTVLKDGRVMFSSFETQGNRDSRLWGLWGIWPDGRFWEPLMSAFTQAAAFHFQTQLSDGRIAAVEYYNLNNNGFGTLLAFDSRKDPSRPPFGNANPSHATNPSVRRGIWYFQPGHPAHLQPRYKQYPFSPPGLTALTGFTHGEDEASSRALDGSFAGKVTHPSGAPGNDVLLVWTPGPANNLNRPTTIPYYDGGIYLLRGGASLDDHRQLVLIKNDPAYNEMQPRALVPYSAIHGVAEPADLPFLPNDGSVHSALPAGTPFGLVGTSSFLKRNTFPGVARAQVFDGLDPLNTTENETYSNWFTQGSDAGKYSDADIHSVRIVSFEGVAHRSYGPGIGDGRTFGFRGHADAERLRILGEIPLRKTGATDPDGNPDTSFLAKIPADVPFTFQTLDKDGLVLNMAQTWHMVRPGEMRANCGGCHAHSQLPTDFAQTAAGRGAVPVADLIARPLDVEYHRDIKPILQRSCVACHTKSGRADAGLILDDDSLIQGYEGTWHRLANDESAQWGIGPVIPFRAWRQTNASRYIRKFQSRRSLLMWKVMGRRLDGWANADHPTESTPGNAATLPSGADPNGADIDFIGTAMPPEGSGLPPLSGEEKRMFARWIDLGCPISSKDATLSRMGWFSDELKPTLTVSLPRAGENAQPLARIRIGAFDLSGLDQAAFSVIANFAVNGKSAGSELGPLFSETAPGVWTLDVSPPVNSIADGLLTVKVKDLAGNYSVVDRSFAIGSSGPAPVTLSPATASLFAAQTQQFASNVAVAWSLSPNIGSISPTGLYTAPASVSTEQTVILTATSTADPSKSATATVQLQPSVSLTVSPASVTLAPSQTQQFTANATVTWSLNPNIGAISPAGLYTAPASISTAQAVTLTAKSTADPSKSATATVQLQPSVSLTVSPASVTLAPSQTQQFTANAAVTWSLNPNVGTISASGLYTAPASITTAQTVTLTGKSTADPTKSATAAISLKPPDPTPAVTPSTVTLNPGKTQQFTANFAARWSIDPVIGAISTGGLYTAPATFTDGQNITVKATGDAGKSATASVTLKLISILTISPSQVSLLPVQKRQFTASEPVTWSVEPALGVIDASGLYAAPASVTARTTVAVTAKSKADPTRIARASVTLLSYRVSPETATLRAGQSVQLRVNRGEAKWSMPAGSPGTLNSAGRYAAPTQIKERATIVVTATDVSEPLRAAKATITLIP